MNKNRVIKWVISFIILASLLLSAMPSVSAEEPAADIKVTINGEYIDFDQPPVIIDGRTLVPIRAVCEKLGADVYWYEPDQGVMIVKNEIKLTLFHDGNYISKMVVSSFAGFLERLEQNEGSYITAINLDVPPQIIGDRTLLPIRAVCEELGAEVDWDEENRTVVITCSEDIIDNRNTDTEFFDSYTNYAEKYILGDVMTFHEVLRVRLDYLLKEVDVSDSSEYVIVRAKYRAGDIDYKAESVTYEAVTDTSAIKANKDIFSIINILKMPCVGPSTCDIFSLYKDGEWLDLAFYFPLHSRSIELGTLEFEPVNVLQYDLLSGAKVVEEGENYTIAYDAEDEYYYLYAHGADKLSPDAVVFVTYEYTIEWMPRPTNKYGSIIEFAIYDSYYTKHFFFDTEELKVSESYSDIKAVNGNLIVYQEYFEDAVIVVHDMLDTTKDRREIILSSEEVTLLEAEFRSGTKLWLKYELLNGDIKEKTFNLKDFPIVESQKKEPEFLR